MIVFALLIVAAYLVGSIPTAYLIAKWARGIDIRRYGSGNVGSTNLARSTSKRLGIPVIFFDLAKGAAMVWAAQSAGLETYQQVIVGAAAIIGHNWPIFLRFNGGRGVLTSIGVLLAIAPKLAVTLIALSFLWLPFGHLAMGTISSFVLLPITAWFSTAPVINWFFSPPFASQERLPVTLSLLAITLIIALRRLLAPKTTLTATVPLGQLVLNRLLFDRDIRDRKAWIDRIPSESRHT